MVNNGAVVVTGEQYEHFNGVLHPPVEDALVSMASASAEAGFGGEIAASEPTRVEISPYCIDRPGFLVRSMHKLDDFDVSGGLLVHEFTFGLQNSGRRIVAQTDGERRHVLSGEPAIFLSQLGLAAQNASKSPLLPLL
jgi:hypothetical protein